MGLPGEFQRRKALSDAKLELPDVSEMNESRVYRLRAFSHSHINTALSSSHQDNCIGCRKIGDSVLEEPAALVSFRYTHFVIIYTLFKGVIKE